MLPVKVADRGYGPDAPNELNSSKIWSAIHSFGVTWFAASPSLNYRLLQCESTYIKHGSPSLRFVAICYEDVIDSALVDSMRAMYNTVVRPVFTSPRFAHMALLVPSKLRLA